MRLIGCCLLVGLLWPAAASAQPPDAGPPPAARELLARAAAYVSRFVAGFSNVVAEEEFRQDWQSGERRRLTSDFLLVQYPGAERLWLAFRDVTAVNGRPVRDQQERLTKLFLEPFEDAVRRAQEISAEASRHSLVPLGALSSPLAVLAWLQPSYQGDFIYSLGDLDTSSGVRLRALELEEIPKPTPFILAESRPPFSAVAWVEEETGRVVRTEARSGPPDNVTAITTFRFDEALGIDVPDRMQESRINRNRVTRGGVADRFTGVATYSRFRRFSVRTQEDVETPASAPQQDPPAR